MSHFERLRVVLLTTFVVGTAATAPVQQPVLLRTIRWLETSWFGSPAIVDLDGDGSNELVGAYYSIYVWDKNFNQLAKMDYGSYHKGRIYAPPVVADLENDGIMEVVVGGSQGRVAAYEWKAGTLSIKQGWPVITYNQSGMTPEVRSLAAADLDRDGTIEIIAANTQTDSNEPQVYVYRWNGTLYQPANTPWQAWPRYNAATGLGNDADANGPGNHGYGCYGLNLGVGNLDDDPELEIVVTFDNHQINVFDHNGVSFLASDFFLNRSSSYANRRLNWGQFIRWYDPTIESDHYHLHVGDWPSPIDTPWLQWTASPCNVVDVNLDGRNEVVGVPNVELHEPYVTIHHSVMVLEGNYGDGSRSARRLAGWDHLPGSGPPQSQSDPWYPPPGIPAPTTVDVVGDAHPEIIVPLHDGYLYAFAHDATRLWRYNFTHGVNVMYASEVLAADLNQDGTTELVFTTYGDPESIDPGVAHGFLVGLDVAGQTLFDIELPIQGSNGNGKGAPAAPTLGDLDGDGDLEIVVQTFDGNCFVYSVPGSSTNLLLWPTARGSYLRQGSPPPMPPGADRDGDGLPDWWEIRFFSSPTNADPQVDSDNDGMSNVSEFRADTIPTNAVSRLRFDTPLLSTNGPVLRWSGGTNARQILESREGLDAIASTWRPFWTNEPPTSVSNSFLLPPANGQQYYRLRVE